MCAGPAVVHGVRVVTESLCLNSGIEIELSSLFSLICSFFCPKSGESRGLTFGNHTGKGVVTRSLPRGACMQHDLTVGAICVYVGLLQKGCVEDGLKFFPND
jgi:hypothetical protein